MINRILAAAAVVLALAGHVHLAQAATTPVPCLGSTLIIKTSDTRPGRVVSARLDDVSAHIRGDNITVKQADTVVLTFSLAKVSGDAQALIKNMIAIKDICALSGPEANILALLVSATVLPRLVPANVLATLTSNQGSYGGGFVLIIVLFILLVIVGAGFG
jgi:uncharacterized protein (TIGR01732 family)